MRGLLIYLEMEMKSNIIEESNAIIAAQARLFICANIAVEVAPLDIDFCTANTSLVFLNAADFRSAAYAMQDRFCSWHRRRQELRALASRRLNERLLLADRDTRPYNPDSLGHLYRTDRHHIRLRRPFAALADAVRSTIKAARMEDRVGQREGKHRLLRIAYDTSHTSLVFQVMGKHWPALYTAVDTAKYRLSAGRWQAPVWTGKLPVRHPEHFVHAARETPGNVAFYADTDKLEADKLTSMKPGRYLATFYGDILSADEIKQWANKQVAATQPTPLKFVGNDDPLGWVWVYENSQPSCMRYNRHNRYIDSGLKDERHPVTVYAHPENNLALAYIMLPGAVEDRTRFCDTDEYIVGARAIVNTRNKTYLRIYGAGDVQHTAMKEALGRAGYTFSGDTLKGEKLRLVATNNGNLCPYLDGNYAHISVRSSHLLIGKDGMRAQETCGYVREDEDRCYCDTCGEYYDEEDGGYVESDNTWVCDDCIERYFVWAIGRSGTEALYRSGYEDIVYCDYDGRYYLTEYLGNNDMGMTDDGEIYPDDQLVETEDGVYHWRDAVELTYEFNDCQWAHRNCVYHLPNGETCHVDDADKIAEIEALEQEAA